MEFTLHKSTVNDRNWFTKLGTEYIWLDKARVGDNQNYILSDEQQQAFMADFRISNFYRIFGYKYIPRFYNRLDTELYLKWSEII